MAKKREWEKKKKPMGVEPFDVRKAEAHRKGARVYRENPIMHNTYTEKFEKWLRKPGTPRKPKVAGSKVKTISTRKKTGGQVSYDLDKEMAKVKKQLGHYEELDTAPSTHKEFQHRLDSFATQKQRDAFAAQHPTFLPPKGRGAKVGSSPIKRRRGRKRKSGGGKIMYGYKAGGKV